MLNHLVWKDNAARRYLGEHVALVRRLHPGIQVWAHTGGEPRWGHFPHVLRDVGVDCVANHGQHFLPTKEAFHQQLDWLAPVPCVPHICVRDLPTNNYPVAVRTPEMIREYESWLRDYPGKRIIGVMFFNEAHTTETNKQAVYDLVGKLHR